MAKVLTEYNGKMGIWVRRKGGYAMFIPEDKIDPTRMPKDVAKAIKVARATKKSYDLRQKLEKEYDDLKKTNYTSQKEYEKTAYTKDVWDDENKLNKADEGFRKLRKDQDLAELDSYFKYKKAEVEYNYNRNEFGQVNWQGKDRRLFKNHKLYTGKEVETSKGYTAQVTEHVKNSSLGEYFKGRNKNGEEVTYWKQYGDIKNVKTGITGKPMKIVSHSKQIDNYLKKLKGNK